MRKGFDQKVKLWLSLAFALFLPGLAMPTTASAPPRLTVDKVSGGFPERGYAHIRGAGLPPSRRLFLVQCPAEGIDPRGENCDSSHWLFSPGQADVQTDQHGNFHHGHAVQPFRRVMNPDGPTPNYPRAAKVDCAATPCVFAIFAHDGVTQDPLTTVPLTFAGPPGSPRPTSFSAKPTTGLRDGETVRVAGEHAMGPTKEFSLYLCGPDDPDAGLQCGKSTHGGRVDSHGRLSARILVQATFTSTHGTLIDCRRVTCHLSVGIPLQFAPND